MWNKFEQSVLRRKQKEILELCGAPHAEIRLVQPQLVHALLTHRFDLARRKSDLDLDTHW